MAKKKFIICLNDATDEQEREFIKHIKTINVAWWHWLKGTWLITDKRNNLTASELRDKVKDHFPNSYCTVFELRDDNNTWAGFGPVTEEKNMFKWLHDNWNTKE